MKNNQRLDYSSLAELLNQRGLVDLQHLNLALQTSARSHIPFPEMLVSEGLIGDWELSRTVCEAFNLPFLSCDFVTPNKDALNGLDPAFLRKHRLVPLGRHGQLLTVIMPAMVQADVFVQLSETLGVKVLPVVGTVNSNNLWFEANLAADAPSATADDTPHQWSNIFDEGDASVLFDLQPVTDEDPSSSALNSVGGIELPKLDLPDASESA